MSKQPYSHNNPLWLYSNDSVSYNLPVDTTNTFVFNTTSNTDSVAQYTSADIFGARVAVPNRTSLVNESVLHYSSKERGNELFAHWVSLVLLFVSLLLFRYIRNNLETLFSAFIWYPIARKQAESSISAFSGISFIALFFSVFVYASTFFLIFAQTPEWLEGYAPLTAYIIAFCFIFLVYFVKVLAHKLVAYLTLQKDFITLLQYNSKIYWFVFCLALLPLNLFYLLADKSVQGISYYVFVILSIVFFVFFLIRSLRIFIGARVSVFFWILYLCTLEILPVMGILIFLSQ